MIMKRNPIAISVSPLAGRQLDPNWKKSTMTTAAILTDGIYLRCGRIHSGVKTEWRQCRKHHAQQSIVISNSIGNLIVWNHMTMGSNPRPKIYAIVKKHS
jgi:hypothetical protein